MRLVACLLLLSVGAWAQQFTFSPQPPLRGIHETIWYGTACSSAPAQVTTGQVDALLIGQGLAPVMYDQAVQKIVEHNWSSWKARGLRYAGYAAIGAAFFLSNGTIKASPKIQTGVEAGAGFLNVLVPAIKGNLPPVADLTKHLLAGPISVPAGGCAEFTILTAPTKHDAFVVK